MKKVLSILMALGLLISVAACGGGGTPPEKTDQDTKSTSEKPTTDEPADTSTDDSASNSEKIQIGVACNNFNDKWQVYLRNAMEEQAKKYPNFEFTFADGGEDMNKQIGQVEDFISSGVKGIIMIAVNTDAASSMTNACKDAGIPLVTVNRLLSNQDDVTAYVGSDSIEAGIMEAEYLFEAMGGKGKVAVLQGQPGNEATQMRTKGYKDVAAEKYPDIEFVLDEIANWNRDEAMDVTENWIQSGEQFDAILANNDEMAMGAVLALESAGMREGDKKVLVGGIDATIDALEFMKEVLLDVTVFQSPFGQGEASVDIIVKAVNGESVEKLNWIDYELVTPEKVDEYIAKWK